MQTSYNKDIRRFINTSRRRFISIMIITALGITMLTGLYASCQDMYYSADEFFDEQKLYDIQILSTLGLTDGDLEILSKVEGIKAADGGYQEQVFIDVDEVQHTADMISLGDKGLNEPYMLEGKLPMKADEAAVTQDYIDATGKSIGDTLTIKEDIEETKEDDADKSGSDDRQEDSSLDAEADHDADAGQESSADQETDKILDLDVDTDIDLDKDMDLEEAETPTFANTSYTITGIVMDARDIKIDIGAKFQSSTDSDYTFFIKSSAVDSDIYTSIYVLLESAEGINCFKDEYEDNVQTVINDIERNIKSQREQARYDAIINEGKEKITDAENIMSEKFAEADEKFADARKDVDDGKTEIADGEDKLAEEEAKAKKKIADARQEIEDGKQELAEKRRQADEEFANAEAQIEDGQRQLDEGRAELEADLPQLQEAFGDGWPQSNWDVLVNAAAAHAAAGADDTVIIQNTAGESAALLSVLKTQVEYMKQGLQMQYQQSAEAMTEEQLQAQIAQLEALPETCVQAAIGMGKINGGQQALDVQKEQFYAQKEEALQQMDDAEEQLIEGEMTLDEEEEKAKKEIEDARQELIDGKQELADGETELTEKELEYQDKKTEAEQKISDAYAELNDIDMTQWYVQDRTSLSSYSGLKSDMSSIEAVGRVFPVIFLVVAILTSLTTMTRMVEEERGLIGTYKALGFSNLAIIFKYLIFAFIACLMGGILGDICGFIFFPQFVSLIFESLYTLPEFHLRFDLVYGIGGIVMFMVGIVGATVIVCRSELARMPAALMRPKAPRAGARVLMERIPAIWNRLKFLNKVTVRNLFRYKKRLFMTIAGIMGCTALVLCGFAIRDSVNWLVPNQYGKIYQYDMMVAMDWKDNEELVKLLSGDENVKDYLNVQFESIKLINTAKETEKVQLLVVPEGVDLQDYIRTLNQKGKILKLDDEGVLITENAATLLGIKKGSSVQLQDSDLLEYDVTVSGIVQNYLGNTVYMSQGLYENLISTYEPNVVIAHLSSKCADPAGYAESLLDNDIVLSSICNDEEVKNFSFELINGVVAILIVMAGGLAFVVLFTLSNTNVSERVRELATIKVLGFYDGEVHQYVNKETLILTIVGILLGLPVGRVLSGFLTAALNMPSIHFAVQINTSSYVIAAVISFGFAVFVNLITNRTLDRINMVEALKSVE